MKLRNWQRGIPLQGQQAHRSMVRVSRDIARRRRSLLAATIIGAGLSFVTGTTCARADYQLKTLWSFSETDGKYPFAGVVADSGGNLFGLNSAGGANGYGTLFELSPSILSSSRSLTTLISFNGSNGAFPIGTLAQGPGGSYYGITSGGTYNHTVIAGTAFQFTPQTGILNTLVTFNGGTYPDGFAVSPSGTMYVETGNGGTKNIGSLARVDIANRTYSTVASFDNGYGSNPSGNVVIDTAGNVFGTALLGDKAFKYDASQNKLIALSDLSGYGDTYVDSGLVADKFGNLYGTAETGGTFGFGAIFRIDAATGHLTTVASFTNVDGRYPRGVPLIDAQGNLFGTTESGGSGGRGTVYEFNAVTNQLTTLVSFNGANGGSPATELTADANGDLFGTTGTGGAADFGTVFEISVPEPGVPLAILAGLGGLSIRKRSR